ncbi:hypothetical protein DL96DRAFT_1820052 [Flagelloscypha sp. PMI_526]|nr:hypothetical protein DL96DRAFT_1820052 [Flagelloscypha sp. PMI_526]
MSQHDHLLSLICTQPETLAKAKVLLHEALLKTAPGSGFDIGPFKSGLPAICAYIASQKLQNSDVSRIAAQAASCLQKADFEKTYYTVDAAICGARKSRRNPSDAFSGRVTYDTLLSKHKVPLAASRVVPTLVMAEKAVIMHPDYSMSFDEDWLKVLVFWYVCKVIKGEDMFPSEQFAEQHRIPHDIFVTSLLTVRKAVTPIKDKIRQHIRDSRPPKVKKAVEKKQAEGCDDVKGKEKAVDESDEPQQPLPRSPTKSKAPLRPLPSRSPQKRTLTTQDIQDAGVGDSPSKRRRTTESSTLGVPPPTPPDSTTSTPVASRAESSSSHALVSPSPEPPIVSSFSASLPPAAKDIPPAASPPKPRAKALPPLPPLPYTRTQRFRPAYTDERQWCACDHTLRQLREAGERHLEEMTKLYGNPLKRERMEVDL